MAVEASIDIQFAKTYLPKDIINELILTGWMPSYDNKVYFLFPSDDQDLEWKEKDFNSFDLNEFVNSHSPEARIGLVMANNNVGAHILVYPKWMTLTLSINRVYLDADGLIPNFSWYLERLNPFLNRLNIFGLQCELVYSKKQ